MKNLLCFLVFTCVLVAVPAYADSDFTLFGAAQHQGSLTLQTAGATASSSTSFNPGTFGTFGIRYETGKVFGGEHTLAYSPKFLNTDARAFIYNSDFIVQVPLPKVKPYGTAGLGTIISWGTDAEGRPSLGKIGTRFAINYGGGIKVFPAGPVGLRLDIRGYMIPDAKFNLPSLTNPLDTVLSRGQNLNVLEAGIGIVFNIGNGGK
jgi:opacity protein-like surface antigen